MLSHFGSVLSFSNISPKNAHGWGIDLRKESLISKIVAVLGVPHLGTRIRNRIVTKILGSRLTGKSIMDVGSGIGLSGFYFTQFGCDYLGIDKCKYKIEIAHKLAKNSGTKRMKFIRKDFFSKVSVDKKFDFALNLEVLEHVKSPGKMLDKISHFLKDQGLIISSFPAPHPINALSKKYFGHVRVGLGPADIQAFIKGKDLELRESHSFGNSFWAKFIFLADFVLIKYTPYLSGFFFFLFYPLVLLDAAFFKSTRPLGYVVVLKKEG